MTANRVRVTAKADLRVNDVVYDPIGLVTGVVVNLSPIGWADGSGVERVTVQWRTSGYRSEPRATELEKLISGPASIPW